jgi:hypothetical protein
MGQLSLNAGAGQGEHHHICTSCIIIVYSPGGAGVLRGRFDLGDGLGDGLVDGDSWIRSLIALGRPGILALPLARPARSGRDCRTLRPAYITLCSVLQPQVLQPRYCNKQAGSRELSVESNKYRYLDT